MLAQCVPESREQFREACQNAEAGAGHIDLELEINTLKDQRIWVRVIGHLEMLGWPTVSAGPYGSLQNIQAKQVAQIALENSTGWLKLSMTMANMHAWRWDRAQNSFESRKLGKPADSSPQRLPGYGVQTMLARVHPEGSRRRQTSHRQRICRAKSKSGKNLNCSATMWRYRSLRHDRQGRFLTARHPARAGGRHSGCGHRAAGFRKAIAAIRGVATGDDERNGYRRYAVSARYRDAGPLRQQFRQWPHARADHRSRD